MISLSVSLRRQLPGKTEHLVRCALSRRQRFLYEEFMGRSSTRAAMSGVGSFMGMMNVLMQLRKVRPHPHPALVSSTVRHHDVSARGVVRVVELALDGAGRARRTDRPTPTA